MNCPMCGKENEGDAAYCQKCGKSLRIMKICVMGKEKKIIEGTIEYAGFINRLIAGAFDAAIIFFLYCILAILLRIKPPFWDGDFELLPRIILYGIVPWFYWGIMESSKAQATIGKMALKLIVVNKKGERISFYDGMARGFFKFFLGIPLGYIPFILTFFTQRKQSLYDMITGTLVVMRIQKYMNERDTSDI